MVLILIISGSKRPKSSKWKTTTKIIFVPAFYRPFFSTLAPLDKITSAKQRFFKTLVKRTKKKYAKSE